MSSPVHVLFVFNFSPHICKHGECKFRRRASHLAESSGEEVGNDGTQIASFMYLQKTKSSCIGSKERNGQVTGQNLPVHFREKNFSLVSPELKLQKAEMLHFGG